MSGEKVNSISQPQEKPVAFDAETVELVYLYMLKARLRFSVELMIQEQFVLSTLRDYIAQARDMSAEDVQNKFERLAAS